MTGIQEQETKEGQRLPSCLTAERGMRSRRTENRSEEAFVDTADIAAFATAVLQSEQHYDMVQKSNQLVGLQSPTACATRADGDSMGQRKAFRDWEVNRIINPRLRQMRAKPFILDRSHKLVGVQSPAACATHVSGDSNTNFETSSSTLGPRARCCSACSARILTKVAQSHSKHNPIHKQNK